MKFIKLLNYLSCGILRRSARRREPSEPEETLAGQGAVVTVLHDLSFNNVLDELIHCNTSDNDIDQDPINEQPVFRVHSFGSADAGNLRSTRPEITVMYATDTQHSPERGTSTSNTLSPSESSRRNSTSTSQSCDTSSNKPSLAGSTEPIIRQVSMRDKLRQYRQESPDQPTRHYLPKCWQDELLTVEAIANDICCNNPSVPKDIAQIYAEEVHKGAKKIYATLACINKGADVRQLLDGSISDKHLPFTKKRDEAKILLHTSCGTPIQGLDSWDEENIEYFYLHQWEMTAPVFKDGGHIELDKSELLPFIPLEGDDLMKKPKQGAYSEVSPVHIHPSHHEFWDSSYAKDKKPLVAVKRLFSSEKTEFRKEVNILKTLGLGKPHSHLIRLLATYRQKGVYYLLFPYAHANLRTYWEQRPTPAFDEQTVMWSLKQMAGIVNALLRVHDFRVEIPLNVNGAGNLLMQKDAHLSVRKGEELYGRHGDIKPENILWFEDGPEADDPLGVLKLADFGLGRFHGRDSKSKVPPSGIFSSPTYEPPECVLRRPVSRAYDIWSLGCVKLEFITWLLKGNAQIEAFGDWRSNLAGNNEINEDKFFSFLGETDHGPEATIREEVITWVDQLHEHEQCSQLIHDLLDITMKSLLLIDSNERIKAGALDQEMKFFFGRASTDKVYMLKPVPWLKKPRHPRATSDPALLEVPQDKKFITYFTFNDPMKASVSQRASISPFPEGSTPKFKKMVTWPAGIPVA